MSQTNPETDTARPGNPVPLEEADIYQACRDFVLTFAVPALEPEDVFHGWAEQSELPAGSRDYALMSALSSTRQGSVVEEFSAPDPDPAVAGRLSIRGLYRVGVRLDFCGLDDLARQRAQRAALVANSMTGADFFNLRGVSLLHADDVLEESQTGEAMRQVRRYFTTLYLSVWAGLDLECDYFDRAILSRVRNADV